MTSMTLQLCYCFMETFHWKISDQLFQDASKRMLYGESLYEIYENLLV